MACGCRHFEARQRPDARECWRHLNASDSPEVCGARTKACKQMWAKNYSRSWGNYLVKITSWMTYNLTSLSQKEPYKRTIIQNGLEINPERETIIRISHVTCEHLSFLLPAFESASGAAVNLRPHGCLQGRRSRSRSRWTTWWHK